MPELSVVDTHLHVWDPGNLKYPWLEDITQLNKPHLLSDYRQATDGIPIERMVFVQCECDCSQFQQETDWVTELAQEDPRIQGIVSWAPLELGDGASDPLQQLSTNRLVKGIRRIIQFESDDAFCLQPAFVRGVQLLAKFDLHFEICIKGDRQSANTLELVRQCPNVRFIVDHIGKPFIKERRMEPWDRIIQELAALPNTWCKISGLVNEADWKAWTSKDLQPYLDHVFDCFGLDRVMYGGDWPVCTLASSYGQWFDTLSEAVSGYSDNERQKLFRNNAVDFYLLD